MKNEKKNKDDGGVTTQSKPQTLKNRLNKRKYLLDV